MSLLKKLKGLLFPETAEPGQPPPWIDRLQPAKYVSLSGITVPFDYVDLSSFFQKKTAIFGSVNAPGVYVQDNGTGGFRFPMACYFSGGNHDVEAATFLKAVLETGEGTLFHPIFKRIVVVPVGEIEHVSNLVSAANQTTVILEFFETTGLQIGSLPAFDSLLSAFEAEAAAEFASKLNVDDPADEANFRTRVTSTVNAISTALTSLSSGVAASQSQLDDTQESINRSIDTLVGQPLALARQVQILIGTPARIASDTRARLTAYRDLARDIFGMDGSSNGYDFEGQNAFHGDSVFASSLVSYAAVACQENDFQKTSDYINAASDLASLLDEFSTWKDDSYTAIDDGTLQNTDTGDGWMQLQALVGATIGDLINKSFSAITEIKITLDRDRGMQELCYELYGTSRPEQLDFFCSTNNFGGDEYFVINEGREIVYYV